MKKTYKILSTALALGMGLSLLAGCDAGAKGDKGNGWLYGDGTPTADLGTDGDLYLDNSTWNVYAKENGSWTSKGNIKGEQGSKGDKGDVGGKGDEGEQGAPGTAGSVGENGNGWLYGEGVPAAALGKNGDLYLDTASWDVYTKDGDAWAFRENINSNSDYYASYFPEFKMAEGKLLVYTPSGEANDFLATSIQGLFAQIGESKYLYKGGMFSAALSELASIYGKQTEDTTLQAMIEDYKNKFSSGYVLYDVTNAESTNCARTIAGAESIVMIDKTLKATADGEWGLHEVVDATEMKAEECFDQYKDRLNNKGLVYGDVVDTATGIKAIVGLTDFTIACKFFCYYPADKKECGEERDPVLWSQKTPGHMRLEDDAWTPFRHKVYDWCKGATVFGGFPMSEVQTVKISAQYNSPVIVGSPANMTVYGCKEFFGEDALVQKNKFKPITEENYPLDRHYVTIVNADGDNIGVQIEGATYEGSNLMGAARGDFPMGWEMNPSLYAMAPNVVRHYYNNAKAGDSFVCSISGFGHTFARYYDDRSLARLTSHVDEYIGACDLRVAKLLDDGSMFDAQEDRVLNAYTGMKNVEGLLYCTYDGAYIQDNGSVRWFNDKPVVSCRYTLWGGFDEPVTTQVDDTRHPGQQKTVTGVAEMINASSTDSRSIEAYSYVNLHIWSKTYEDVKKMVAAFDDEKVQVVDPLTFIRLIEQRVEHKDVHFTERKA